MNRKIVFVLIVVVLSAILSIFIIFKSRQQNQNISSPIVNEINQTAKNNLPEKFKTFNDPSGFSFSYPETFTVNNIATKDATVYTSLSISSTDTKGEISILVKDTTSKSIDDWLEINHASLPNKKIVLADLEARQYEKEDQIVTVAQDKGVIFNITVKPIKNKEQWLKVNDKIISSFKFTPPETTSQDTSGVGSTSDDVIFEGEEVVE